MASIFPTSVKQRTNQKDQRCCQWGRPSHEAFGGLLFLLKSAGSAAGGRRSLPKRLSSDIVAFLSAKKENADEKIRIKTLSLGITVPDKFYELVEANQEMYLFSPYDVERIYGVPFSYVDITNEYENMVANDAITKYKVNARDLEDEISKLQQESGYPYIVNLDTVNRANPIDGKIVMSNLCSEIAQVQRPSIVNDDQTFAKLGTDVSCNLGSTNIANMMETPDFGRSVSAWYGD